MAKRQNSREQYAIPMEVTNETIRDFGIDPASVTWAFVGDRKVRVILVPATEAQYHAYMNDLWNEQKREERAGRCMIPGKRGGLIRCPDNRDCSVCERAKTTRREDNKPVSLELLAETGDEPTYASDFEDAIACAALLDSLIDRLSEINPRYGKILRMMFDGEEQAKIEERLGMNPHTARYHIRKIRDLVKKMTLGTFE